LDRKPSAELLGVAEDDSVGRRDGNYALFAKRDG